MDVRNNDIEIAKAIYELILARTNERLKDCMACAATNEAEGDDKEVVERSGGRRRCGVSPRRHGGAGVCTRWRDSSLICYNIWQDERTCI